MFKEIGKAADSTVATVAAGSGLIEQVGGKGVYHFQCFDKDGKLKWEDWAPNLVVNQGLQDMNTQYFKGVTYTAAWYIGLVNNSPAPSYVAGDTLASHGWTETTAYAGNRKAVTFGTATTANPSVINNSSSVAQFVMNNTVTVAGAFLCTAASGSTGVLFSASDFQSPGARAVVSGDTLNVTYQFSLTAT